MCLIKIIPKFIFIHLLLYVTFSSVTITPSDSIQQYKKETYIINQYLCIHTIFIFYSITMNSMFNTINIKI